MEKDGIVSKIQTLFFAHWDGREGGKRKGWKGGREETERDRQCERKVNFTTIRRDTTPLRF